MPSLIVQNMKFRTIIQLSDDRNLPVMGFSEGEVILPSRLRVKSIRFMGKYFCVDDVSADA